MKKTLSIIAIIVFILSMLPMSVIAAEINEIDVTPVEQKIIYNDDGSWYSIFVDENGNEIVSDNSDEEVTVNGITPVEGDSSSVTATKIPEKWDSRDKGWVTPVKNQNPFGTCWAHSFCAAAESSLIAQGYATADTIDLSEAHLVYFRDGNYVEGSTIPVQQDKYILSSGTFNQGGNDYDAAATISRWSGLTTEEKYPYLKNETKMVYTTDDMFERDYDLVSTKIYKPTEVDAIKTSIMTYGAVEQYMTHQSKYLVRKNNEYYYYNNNTSNTVNHAVTVVGWDDTISASNFKETPEGDGAWLIKNSWGSSSWNTGYFWMSYYDTSIYSFTEVVASPKEDYDNNYQYNGVTTTFGMSVSNSTFSAANVFTADGTEDLKACSFEINSTDNPLYTCEVSVYGNLSSLNDIDGKSAVAKATVKCDHKGYYTVKFDTPYRLSKGEKFAVITKFKKLGTENIVVSVEKSEATDKLVTYHEAGQSFYSVDSWWVDNAETKYFGNFTIKAYTTDVPPQYNNDALSVNDGSSLNINTSDKYISGINPGTKTLDGLTVKDGFHVEYSDIGTGKELRIYNSKNTLVDTYSFLIYGDIDGDGWYGGQDAVLVNSLYSGMLTKEQIGNIKWLASDCNHDGIVDETDYNIIVDSGMYLVNIDQSSDLALSCSDYTQYVSFINQNENKQTDDSTDDSSDEKQTENESDKHTDENSGTELIKPATFWQKISKFFQSILKFFLGK